MIFNFVRVPVHFYIFNCSKEHYLSLKLLVRFRCFSTELENSFIVELYSCFEQLFLFIYLCRYEFFLFNLTLCLFVFNTSESSSATLKSSRLSRFFFKMLHMHYLYAYIPFKNFWILEFGLDIRLVLENKPPDLFVFTPAINEVLFISSLYLVSGCAI